MEEGDNWMFQPSGGLIIEIFKTIVVQKWTVLVIHYLAICNTKQYICVSSEMHYQTSDQDLHHWFKIIKFQVSRGLTVIVVHNLVATKQHLWCDKVNVCSNIFYDIVHPSFLPPASMFPFNCSICRTTF